MLGANDGIVSTASLTLGVAAAQASRESLLIAAGAGLVAGAMSMAAGEYVSVHSQADVENAELSRERQELVSDPESELDELASIYVARGLDPSLAHQVAKALTAHDAEGAHARDELGIVSTLRARPLQAALASAGSFAVGALLPIGIAVLSPWSAVGLLVSATSLFFLAVLGALSAKIGGAPVGRAAVRVTFWGALAMGMTAGVGALFGVAVA